MVKVNLKTVLLCGAVAAMLSSCGGTKSLAEPTPAPVEPTAVQTEIVLPFSEAKYKSDASTFRAVNSGKSPDLATAKNIATTNAMAELSANVQAVVKTVTELYAKQRSTAEAQEFGQEFDNQIRTVVNQKLIGRTIMDEKAFKEGNVYTYYVVVQLPTAPVRDAVTDKISSDAKTQLAFDKFLFQKTFDAEMEKFEAEQQ